VNQCAFSPGGRWIVSASFDRTLKIWDATTGAEHLTLRGHTDNVTGCAFSPDSRWLISVSDNTITSFLQKSHYSNTLKLWHAQDKTCVLTLPLDGTLSGCTFHPDGEHLVAYGAQGIYFFRLVCNDHTYTSASRELENDIPFDLADGIDNDEADIEEKEESWEVTAYYEDVDEGEEEEESQEIDAYEDLYDEGIQETDAYEDFDEYEDEEEDEPQKVAAFRNELEEMYPDRDKDNRWQADLLFNLGMAAMQQELWENAEEFFQQAFQVYTYYDDIDGLAGLYLKWGFVAYKQRQWERAKSYWNKGLRFSTCSNNLFLQALNAHQLGCLAYEEQQWELSSDHLLFSFRISLELQEKKLAESALYSLALLWQATHYSPSLLSDIASLLGMPANQLGVRLRGILSLDMDAAQSKLGHLLE
jgi:tetratricopeptide (TPR) repeat protein